MKSRKNNNWTEIDKMNQTITDTITPSKREWWVDYLRVIAVFLVIPFHVIISYVENAMGTGPFIIWNTTSYSEGARIVFEFFNPWHMPLLFLLAGFSLVYSLRKRSYGRFIGERIVRLGIPLIFGLFIWNTLMGWYGTLFYYEVIPSENPIYPNLPGFGMFYKFWWLEGGLMNTGHMWFMVVLLILSLFSGGIIAAIQKNRNNNPEKSSVVLEYLTSPPAMVFWASCTVLIKFIPALNTIVFNNGFRLSAIFSVFQWNEILFFIYGMLLAGNIASLKKFEKHWVWMLPVGFVLIALWAVFKVDYADYLSFVRNLGAWMFINGLIGVTSKYLNKPTRGLKYIAKSSMTVYILHLPLEIIVGYYLMRNPMNPILEIFMLIGINAVLCVGIYEIFRQINKVIPGIGLVLGIKEKQIWMRDKNQKKIVEVPQNQKS